MGVKGKANTREAKQQTGHKLRRRQLVSMKDLRRRRARRRVNAALREDLR